MHWLLLIRWKNLAIVVLTQWIVWYCTADSGNRLSLHVFSLLCSATVFITAAGYIINDIYDTKIDAINKPDLVIIGNTILKPHALWAYWVCNSIGLLLAIIAASTKGNAKWAMIQLSCILLLWLYSAYLKRWLLIGNLAVAVLTALVIFIILLYQPIMVVPLTISPLTIGVGYALFAFMTTWLRELVKDMEDAPGDAAYGCNTLPVKYGIEVSAIFASALVVGILLSLGFAVIQLFSLHYHYLGSYIILLLIAPLSVWSVFLGKNNTPAHYHKAASWLKVIMLPGICSLIVYYLETQHLLCAR